MKTSKYKQPISFFKHTKPIHDFDYIISQSDQVKEAIQREVDLINTKLQYNIFSGFYTVRDPPRLQDNQCLSDNDKKSLSSSKIVTSPSSKPKQITKSLSDIMILHRLSGKKHINKQKLKERLLSNPIKPLSPKDKTIPFRHSLTRSLSDPMFLTNDKDTHTLSSTSRSKKTGNKKKYIMKKEKHQRKIRMHNACGSFYDANNQNHYLESLNSHDSFDSITMNCPIDSVTMENPFKRKKIFRLSFNNIKPRNIPSQGSLQKTSPFVIQHKPRDRTQLLDIFNRSKEIMGVNKEIYSYLHMDKIAINKIKKGFSEAIDSSKKYEKKEKNDFETLKKDMGIIDKSKLKRWNEMEYDGRINKMNKDFNRLGKLNFNVAYNQKNYYYEKYGMRKANSKKLSKNSTRIGLFDK